MIDKKVEEKIKNLFLNKKYEEVIKFSEKFLKGNVSLSEKFELYFLFILSTSII